MQQGNLETTNLPEVLLDLYFAKRSGILRLSRNDVKKSVYFLDGTVVFAHSNQKHDRLGETLLRLGKITQEEFEFASRDVIEKGKRLGQALCELGFISGQEVDSSVHYQLQQILYSLFDWDFGDYEFIERERPVFEDIMIDVSTPMLIVDGIRNITNPSILERAYQGNEEQILFLNKGIPRLSRMDVDFSEETILACIDDNKSIAAVRQLARLSRIEFDRALFSLLLCGTLQFQKDVKPSVAPEQQPARVEEKSKSFTTQQMEDSSAGLPGRMKTLSEDELRQLILLTQTKFHEATDEEVLGVLPDCTLQEIDKAHQELRSRFHSPYSSQDRFLELKAPLKAILDRINQAHDNLVAKVTSQLPLSEAPLESIVIPPRPSAPVAAQEPAPQKVESEIPLVTPAREKENEKTQPEKESIPELQEQVRKQPGNTLLLRKLGKRFYETGKPMEGEKQFLRALELEPQSIENHFALVEFYQSMGLKIKAFKHLNIILQLQPNNGRAMEMLNLPKSKKPLYEIGH